MNKRMIPKTVIAILFADCARAAEIFTSTSEPYVFANEGSIGPNGQTNLSEPGFA